MTSARAGDHGDFTIQFSHKMMLLSETKILDEIQS
jgi:hypothetical protein